MGTADATTLEGKQTSAIRASIIRKICLLGGS